MQFTFPPFPVFLSVSSLLLSSPALIHPPPGNVWLLAEKKEKREMKRLGKREGLNKGSQEEKAFTTQT